MSMGSVGPITVTLKFKPGVPEFLDFCATVNEILGLIPEWQRYEAEPLVRRCSELASQIVHIVDIRD